MDEIQEEGNFASVVSQYVVQSGYNACQLSRLSGLPRMTLVNWLEGQTKKPRAWQDVVKLAQVLRLSKSETNALLGSANYPPLARLQVQAQSEGDQALLAFWHEERTFSDKQPPFQAISDLPTFTGREAALQTLQKWLSADHHPTFYVLEGTAGVGKTVLAARLAYRLRPHLPDGVLWARLDATNSLTILRQFAEAYGRDVTSYEDLDSRSQVVRGLLAQKRALIVLDNVQNSQQIQSLLPPSGPCAVLVTTRRRNLALAHGTRHSHVEPFTEAEALVLFARVLGEETVINEQARFAEIADVVGRLPLAIDIIACRLAYEPGWSAADLLAQVRRENNLLNNLVLEERCVRSAFAASYRLLAPGQQRFFAATGTFGGEDFGIEAAAAVANINVAEAKVSLRVLFCLSLVRRGRPGRYRLIPLLRTFAREKIDEDEMWQRLVDYFVTYVERYERDIDALELEKNNILAALAAAREQGMSHALKRGLKAFSYFLAHRGLSMLDQVHSLY
jgi:hypothetical protein